MVRHVCVVLDRVLDEAIASHTTPGIVALAADESGVFYQGARGRVAPGAAAPISLDSVFRIASMTKAITSAAAMKLVEQGKLGLEQPMAEIAPEHAEAVILLGFDGDGTPRTRKPRRAITLRHLALHSSALPRTPPSLGKRIAGPDPFGAYNEDLLYRDLIRIGLEVAPGTYLRVRATSTI